jgi:hypothetical protein
MRIEGNMVMIEAAQIVAVYGIVKIRPKNK